MSLPTLSQVVSTFVLSMQASITVEKGVKQEGHAHRGGSSSSSYSYDEKLDNIMTSIQELSTKMSGLATIMHSQHIRCETKFTYLQIQLDQIQRKLEEDED